MTLPEVLLWRRLRGDAIDARFRRQHPIGPYVVDFCCIPHRLIVEVDGAIHDRDDRARHDIERERFLVENGYRVIRAAAADILRDAESAATSIAALVSAPLHHASHGPPPRSGEDRA